MIQTLKDVLDRAASEGFAGELPAWARLANGFSIIHVASHELRGLPPPLQARLDAIRDLMTSMGTIEASASFLGEARAQEVINELLDLRKVAAAMLEAKNDNQRH